MEKKTILKKMDIEYEEYDSSIFTGPKKVDVRKVKNIKSGKMSFSILGLAFSVAKSLLTRTHEWSAETTAFARSYFEVLPFLVTDKDGYIALDSRNEKIVRDFSKTTRHGELAQGLNYLFARNVLNAITLYDFDYYLKNKLRSPGKYKGRKPDFIMVYPNGEIGILESKGTVCADPSPYMYSGHEQCEDGKDFFAINSVKLRNTYVAAVSFATEPSRMKRNTKIYYADPSGDDNPSRKDITEDRLYEYSKFFFLAGNQKAYEQLRDGKLVDIECIYQSFDLNDEGVIARWKISNTQTIQLGISKELEKYLCGEMKEFPEQKKADHPDDHKLFENKFLDQYKDGTYISLVEQ